MPARERGELSCEIGNDRAWMFRLKREMQSSPLANSVMDALRPLAQLGVDMEMLEFVVGGTRPEMQAKLNELGIASQYSVDFALFPRSAYLQHH